MKLVRLALAVSLAVPALAFGADDEEEQLALLFSGKAKVSSVSKGREPEDIREAAAQVTVISKEEIRALGYRTLSDLLQGVPEAFAGGDRMYPIAAIRGFARAGDYNTRVLLLLDGHVLNEPWNNYAPMGTDFPIDLAQVERIEVIAGPVSSLYGSNAFFGAINVVTRTPQRLTTGGSITAGTPGYTRATAWWGNGAAESDPSRWHVIAYATANDMSGETIRYATFGTSGAGAFERTDWDRNAAGYVRMARGPVSVFATAYARRRGVIGGGYDSSFGDRRSHTGDAMAAAEVGLRAVDTQSFGLRFRLYGNVYRYDDLYRYDPEPVFHDLAISRWAGAEAVAEWRTGPSSLVVSLEDTYAFVSQDSFERQGAGTNPPDPASPVNAAPRDDRKFNLVRASLHETLRFGESVKLVAGAYAENHDFYGLAVAPRFGLVVHPWKTGTIKALYGRGFRSPSIYEAFFDDQDALISNPDMKAETVDGVELNVRQSLGQGAEAFAGAFYGNYQDLIVATDVEVAPGDFRIQYQNRDDGVVSAGATAGIQLRSTRGVLRLDATAFHFDDPDQEFSAVQGAPEWVAHAVGLLPIERGRMTIGARLSAVGARPGRDEGRLAPYVLADAGVRVNRVWKNLGVTANVSNLFDARYGQPAGDEYVPETLPEPGRRVFFEARWDW